MKKIKGLLLGLVVVIATSCKMGYSGELAAFQTTSFKEPQPLGMVLVKRGTFLMGGDMDSTATWGMVNKAMQVSVENFWMDQTEVTNAMYKVFVKAVADSVFRSELGEEYLERNSKGLYKRVLNREQQREYEELLYVENPTFPMMKMIRTELLNYHYRWYDAVAANQRDNQLNAARRNYNTDLKYQKREVYYEKDSCFMNDEGTAIEVRKVVVQVGGMEDFMQTRIVNVYPDTTVWVNDFKNSNTIDYARNYFSSAAYNNYPVVGVTWEQATAFSSWRTDLYNDAGNYKKWRISPYRLPTETEWEYAAKANSVDGKYPWKNDSVTFEKRKNEYEFYANFKPGRGDFSADGFIVPSPVGVFKPNELGLYDMAGNVAEWTSSAYFEFGSSVNASMNPGMEFNALSTDPYMMKRKVVRGGSFKDPQDFISSKIRSFEYQNVPRSYIGFRNVRRRVGE